MKKYYLILLLVCQFTSCVIWANSFVISDIRFEGLHKISKDAVLQVIPVGVGKLFNTDDTAEVIHAIFKTGFFKNVILIKDDNTLVVKVIERPTIAKLELLGIKSKEPVEKILKEINLSEGRIYDPAALIKVEQEIEHYYLSKGNYGIKVQSKVVPEERNRVAITISIYVGDEAKIKKISIIGNSAFKEKTLLKQLLHAPSNWTSWFSKDNRYAKEKHIAELGLLQSYYLDRGYVNFQIDSSQVSLGTNKQDVYITINVAEGDKYYFGNINLAGKFVVPKKELQQLVEQKIREGMVFSREVLLDVQKELEMCMGKQGYGNAQAKLNIENDDDLKKMHVKFFLVPGMRLTVRRIDIIGNRLTQDKVLRNGIEQTEGSWISKKHIQEGKEYMLREGYAGEVEIESKPVIGKTDQVDVVYKMEEQRTAQFSGGIAYSASEKLMYNLAADFRNFLGTGRDLNFSFDKSKVTQSYSFGYSDPFFTNDGIGMSYNLYKRKSNLSKTSNVFDYGVSSIGGDVTWQFPLSKYNYFLLGVGADQTKLDMVMGDASTPREAKAFIHKQGSKFKEYSVSIGWKHRSLDQYIFPTKGAFHRILLKSTLPNSSLKYYSIDYANSWYYPLTGKYVLNLSSEFGYMASYKRSQYFPFFKHYYVGGAESVRGFEERSLGPKDSNGHPFGGNLLVTGKVSMIFPPPFFSDVKSVRTALFLDAGQVYDMNYKYEYDEKTGNKSYKKSRNPHGLRYSIGLSFTWHSPLGVPVVMSIANPINAKKTDEKRHFAFSFAYNI